MSVKHALLALLSEGPKYGMQLRDGFEAATGDVWPLNVGQVYTTLQRLERDGLVESDGGDDEQQKKSYLITARGRTELREWLHMPPGLAPPPRDELLTKVLLATRVPGTDVHEVIQAHRRQVVELMQEWTRVKEEPGEFDLPLALVIDSELTRLGAVARWLDLADEHVRHAAAEPAPADGAKLRRRVVVRR
jgi:DNA-binding PadR family transcriptional regulator